MENGGRGWNKVIFATFWMEKILRVKDEKSLREKVWDKIGVNSTKLVLTRVHMLDVTLECFFHMKTVASTYYETAEFNS